jgi:NTP pyrophosphatase (non-canonical NTP hydrolase)
VGDVLWFLACFCSVNNIPFERLGQENIKKLASRQQRGTIDGNGDNR